MNQANANSLVLMDEVGRGTSTQDGLAIAHACVNYLTDKVGCLTLFATHYFELTELAEEHPMMFNQHLVTQEINGQLLLLHKIAKGSTHRSFGLHVAKMAGVPDIILQQAQQYLDSAQSEDKLDTPKTAKSVIQTSHYQDDADKVNDQMDLDLNSPHTDYNAAIAHHTPEPNPALEQLTEINPDELTPKQALEFIYSLKELLNQP